MNEANEHELSETVSGKSPPAKRGRGRPPMRGLTLANRQMARACFPGHTERSIRNLDRAGHVLGFLENRHPELAGWFKTGRGFKTTVLVALDRFPIQWWADLAKDIVNRDPSVGVAVRFLGLLFERNVDKVHALDLDWRRRNWLENVCIEYRCLKQAVEGGERCRKHERATKDGAR